MDISVVHDYQIELDNLLRFFSEEELITDKYQQLAAKNVKVLAIDETDDGFAVKTERDVPANVPGVLKSILGSFNTIKQNETWHWQEDESLLCKMAIEIVGVPAQITGTMRFTEPAKQGDGKVMTSNRVKVNVKSSMPLIGSTLVNFITDDIKLQMQNEYEFLQQAVPELAE
ncbi:hypothetical protein A3K86_02670 [Photobacterium jeanii]|uniref:DUF2505 domain-containing protein n=1 Tax=Photobacterium jeanii TaxID=858640 RepID=A0A178KKR6_9GAMM|nr:DUF2505 domain-containing protein [Photobacterium jeanii]OAN17841.1 hypothetical protein A3K86_02670 [Photobacterium jeanii]PST92493.1 DUF2505 domain-containing protein [Photobacterium jeanii]